MSKNFTRKWTLEICKAKAREYQSMDEWRKNCRSSYNSASSKGWLVECKKEICQQAKG